MEGKICLVTGANAGIGRETCLALASKGAEVIMSARNKQGVEKARDEIIRTTGNANVHIIIADLSNPHDVVVLSDAIKARYVKLDILVNNAGIFLTRYTENSQGFETQWMVNYLAPYILTRRLMGLLKKSPESRIINVSSNAHHSGQINFPDPNGQQNYHGFKAYAQSKLANILFTKELAQRLSDTHVSSYAMHPGVVRTNIGNKNSSGWMAWLWKLAKPFMLTSSKGAETVVYLATAPELKSLSGQYFIKKQPHPSSKLSLDTDLAEKLWLMSENAVSDYL
jgi:NAD(P)-dependent dehydrogenase (short-subunit alcohol dehydrogenase family)